MVLTFFGLHPDSKADVILEPIFILMYYGGFTYKEAYNMPVSYKRWFIDRISRELSRTSDDGHAQSRALHDNSPDVRALSGHARAETPSRLRRFT